MIDRRVRAAAWTAIETLRVSLDGLARYKLRSALSVLGMAVGIAGITLMLAISAGARREALDQFTQLGLDNLVVRNAFQPARDNSPRQQGLRLGDSDHLTKAFPAVLVVPLTAEILTVSGVAATVATTVLSVGSSYERVAGFSIANGRSLTPVDEQQGARVCLIGRVLARQLFAREHVIGEKVRIADDWYSIVGEIGTNYSGGRSDGPLVPRDFQRTLIRPLDGLALTSKNPYRMVDEIWLHVQDQQHVLTARRRAEAHLEHRHQMRDFETFAPLELLNRRLQLQRNFDLIVGSISVLALFVGASGVFNVMLTAVMERIREIGVRRAVGARRSRIVSQFLVETIVLTLLGGIIGVVAGLSGTYVVSAVTDWPTVISMRHVLAALVVSAVTGGVAGVYPAAQAARWRPVDALRYE